MAKGKNKKQENITEIEYVCERNHADRRPIISACTNAVVPILNQFGKKTGEEIVNCKRIDKDGIHCTATADPRLKWKKLGMFLEGHCNLATHLSCRYSQLNSGRIIEGKITEKVRVGQQKQGRR